MALVSALAGCTAGKAVPDSFSAGELPEDLTEQGDRSGADASSLADQDQLRLPELVETKDFFIPELAVEVTLPDGIPDTPDATVQDSEVVDQTGCDLLPAPVLQLPLSELTFVGLSGQWVSDPQTVVPENEGGGTLVWKAQSLTSWLAVEPTEGELGEGFTIHVIAEEAPGEPGTHQGEITVTVPAAEDEPESLAVALELVGTQVGPFATQFAYDEVDRLTSIVHADGLETLFAYELGNDPVQITWPDGTLYSCQYDDAGRLVLVSGPAGEMKYDWQVYGLPSKVHYPDDMGFTYSHDSAGRLAKLEYPDGASLFYNYDEYGLLTSVDSWAGEVLFEYDALGRLVKRTFPGGVSTSLEYDEEGNLVASETTDPSGQLVVRWEQTLNSRGLRASVTEITQDETWVREFAYDAVGRLAQEQGPEGAISFQYDLAGRRVLQSSPTAIVEYSYDTDGRMVRAGDTVFRHDARGRTVEAVSPSGTQWLEYDDDDHLLGVKSPAHDIAYVYAPDGTLHGRLEGGVEEKLYQARVDGLSQVLYREVHSGEQTGKVRYVFGQGWLLEEREGQVARIMVQDLLGNVSRLIALDGTVELSTRFDAFGNRAPGDSYPVGYRGEVQDIETGIVHLRARDYDPRFGLFLSKDSGPPRLTGAAGLDAYRYAGGDPVNHVDRDGLEAEPDFAMSDVMDYIMDAVKKLELAEEKDLAIIALISIEAGGEEPITFSWDFKEGKGELSGQMDIPFIFVPEGRGITEEAKWINGWLVQKFANGAKTPFTQKWDVSISDFFPSVKGDLKITLTGKIFSTKELVYPKGWGNKGYFGGSNGPKGGVDLNKAASVLAQLGELEGAAYDPVSGQLVLYGSGPQVALPPMATDDLVAAYRSVFEHAGEDPGVTIGTVPPPPGFEGEQGVGYSGGVEQTHLGWVLFEADRVLKSYTMGEDNVTGEAVQSLVPGYESVLDRIVADGGESGAAEHRLWFVPDSFLLGLSPESDNSMVFTEASLKVLTESKLSGETGENAAAAGTAAHFTDNFDLYAEEQPVWQELLAVARIVSVLQWMRDEGIPLDTGWFDRYQLPAWQTPLHTPTNTVSGQTAGGATVTVTGGVDMEMVNSYHESLVAGQTAQLALGGRPGEEIQEWTFTDNGEQRVAVALSVAPTPRAGYRWTGHRDARASVPGAVPFELVRYCAPFAPAPGALGWCWDFRPYELRPTGPNKLLAWPGFPEGRLVPQGVAWVDRRGNRETAFEYSGTADDKLLFKGLGFPGTLHLEPDSTWTLHWARGQVAFREDLTLSWEEDPSGNRVTFVYDDQSRLVAIQHSCGLEFTLEHDATGRTVSAWLPGAGTVTYGYDGDHLTQVEKSGAPPVVISYGPDHVPLAASSMAGPAPAAVSHDFLGRVVEVELPDGHKWQVEYENFGHEVLATAPDGTVTLRVYDEAMRLTKGVDALGRQTVYEYGQELEHPTAVTDPAGRTTTFQYDGEGRLVETQEADGRTTQVFYDEQSRPVAIRRSDLPDLFIERDESGRMTSVYDRATLLVEEGVLLGVAVGDSVTEFGWDVLGEISQVSVGSAPAWSVTRDDYGNPAVITSPSGMEEYRVFDEQGRVTQLSRPDGSWVELSYHSSGQVKTVTTAGGTYEIEADELGQILGITDPAGAATSYAHDELGRLVSVVHPDGANIVVERDELGRLVKAQDATGYSVGITYDQGGRVVQFTSGMQN